MDYFSEGELACLMSIGYVILFILINKYFLICIIVGSVVVITFPFLFYYSLKEIEG